MVNTAIGKGGVCGKMRKSVMVGSYKCIHYIFKQAISHRWQLVMRLKQPYQADMRANVSAKRSALLFCREY